MVLTDGQFLCFTATTAGPKRIELPRKCDVLRAPDAKPLARGVEHLDIEMQLGETKMFLLR